MAGIDFKALAVEGVADFVSSVSTLWGINFLSGSRSSVLKQAMLSSVGALLSSQFSGWVESKAGQWIDGSWLDVSLNAVLLYGSIRFIAPHYRKDFGAMLAAQLAASRLGPVVAAKFNSTLAGSK